MQVIPALGRRTFSSTARQSARAILQGERGRWWKTEGAVASVAVPASPFARVVDATDIMVTNVQTLAKNPFAEQVAMQAPNRKETWSASQRPRGDAIRGARFEQTDLALQVGSAV